MRFGYRRGMIDTRVPACPECDTPGVPLLFGLPVTQARAAARDGQLALGGCVEPEDPPNWQCPRQHRWRHHDEGAWDRHLLAVLARYGYRDPDA